jgi:hypothetical protein
MLAFGALLAVLLVGSYENPSKGPCPINETSLTIAGGAICTPKCSLSDPCPTKLPPGFPSTATKPPVGPICDGSSCLLTCNSTDLNWCGPARCRPNPGTPGVCVYMPKPTPAPDLPTPAPVPPPTPASSLFTLRPETVVQHPAGINIQFPDSAFPFLAEGTGGNKLMFWTDGKTYRTTGASINNQSTPDPATPVLGNGPNNTYDMNGNWLLSVHRLSGVGSGVGSAQELVGFTHVENHQFNCSGPHAEWNGAAVVRSSDDGRSWSRQGLAIYDPQPCAPKFGGAGFCSVLPDRGPSDVAFRGWGGCTSYISKSPVGAAGSWKRYYNGSFDEAGVGGEESCLPGLGRSIACPNVIWSSFWQRYVMVYSNWGQQQLPAPPLVHRRSQLVGAGDACERHCTARACVWGHCWRGRERTGRRSGHSGVCSQPTDVAVVAGFHRS